MSAALERTDPKALGERLRDARVGANMTQGQAAAALGLARTTLVAIEAGGRRVQPGELIEAARLYDVAVSDLLRPEAVRLRAVPQFRAMPGTKPEATEAAGKLLVALAAAEAEIEGLLGQPLHRNYPPEQPILAEDVAGQASDAALDLRQRLGLGLAPIPDLLRVLEGKMGVRVFVRRLGTGSVSGAFFYDEAVGACMLLNGDHPPERRDMTAAHELGHLVSSRQQATVVEPGRAPATKEERFARAFAVEFLMPAAMVRGRFRDLRDAEGRFGRTHLAVLARDLGVSAEALCRRLEELGLVRRGTWETLHESGFSTRNLDSVLGPSAPELRNQAVTPRVWLLASEAHRRGLLSEGQLARMLRMDRLDVREMLVALDGYAEEDVFESLAPG